MSNYRIIILLQNASKVNRIERVSLLILLQYQQKQRPSIMLL